MAAELWDSALGRALVAWTREQAHRSDDDVFFEPELQGRVSTVARRLTDATDTAELARAVAPTLVRELHSPATAGAIYLVSGIRPPPARERLTDWVELAPLDEDILSQFISRGIIDGRSELPVGVNCAVLSSAIVSRDSLSAPLDASFLAAMACDAVLTAHWLVSGMAPQWFARIAVELADLQAFPALQEKAPAGRGYVDWCPTAHVNRSDLVRCLHLLHRRDWMDTDSFEPGTALSLRSAYFLLDAISHSPDASLRTMLAASLIEAAFGTKHDNFDKAASRAKLALCEPSAQRSFAKRMNALREIRNSVTHGERPLIQHHLEFVGSTRNPNEVDMYDFFMWVERDVERASLDVARAAFGALLAVCVDVPPGATTATQTVTKAAFLDSLDTLNSSDPATRSAAALTLANRIPSWARLTG